MAPGNALTPRVIGLSPGTHARRLGFELPARAESVALARRRVREWLLGRNIDQDTRDTVALVVSELVTNAVVHTASDRVGCELSDSEGRLRISVQDQGVLPTGPRLRRADPEEGGRGLLLVDAVSSAWGAHEDGSGPGRVVWAELLYGAGGPC
ncbi:ATP-binding protein [Streptomyces sp. A3M-1-3]|uniref:ATP-binding protein n=1 Tax=Streptomyces sp. A3M-1-3 TaxID=2962044 RepID=UPI0020B69244|nr:ATP-binding protein [Streptomyces sp. A3M-1-3]MCP3818360.1 ATP-binding protein [Streptomyces sp. A3M-1-3]